MIGVFLGLILFVVVLVVVLGVAGISIYNKLVANRLQVDNGWAQIDVQLNRRADLVPNLVETVKGYASHEKETLEGVIQARNMGVTAQTPADKAVADNMLTGALSKLFALQEAYPDLKANQNFLQLQEELTATEDRIAYARQFYNDRVRIYNTSIQQFPGVIVAGFGNFEPRDFFEVADAVKEVPKVQF
jgi:LemA protein